jgi:transcriptional regulator with XRE-family HTH domain
MELNEKLIELRKHKGLTQEELAQFLYVSRTAVSKWESGRGVPNIDSLKAISRFYSVSLDELLSIDALMGIAEDDRKQREQLFLDQILGLLDSSIALLFVLPFFGLRTADGIQSVSLIALTGIAPYLKILFFLSVLVQTILGIATLALQNSENPIWMGTKTSTSLLVNSFVILLFLVSRQPYAAVFSFILLLIKGAMLLKRA